MMDALPLDFYADAGLPELSGAWFTACYRDCGRPGARAAVEARMAASRISVREIAGHAHRGGLMSAEELRDLIGGLA